MTACEPSSTALEMATVIPRSLNEPVGIQPLVFDVNLAAASHLLAEARRIDQRRGALVERDDGRGVGDGKKFAVAGDEAAVVEEPVHGENVSTRIIRGGRFTQASFAIMSMADCIWAFVAVWIISTSGTLSGSCSSGWITEEMPMFSPPRMPATCASTPGLSSTEMWR